MEIRISVRIRPVGERIAGLSQNKLHVKDDPMRPTCTKKSFRILSAALLPAFLATGCAQNKYDDLKAFVQAHDHQEVSSIYRVETPDVISIESPTCTEVDGETQMLDLNGTVTLSLVGEVKVSGLTPREVEEKLENLLSVYYRDPEVKVRVIEHVSKKIYVMGEVSSVGPMPFTGRDTVMDVLAKAQPSFLAWRSQIKVIRPNANPNEVKEIVVDVDKMIKQGDMRGNFLLEEGDIVYVPPTPLGWVGLRVQEALFPFSPIMGAAQLPVDARRTYNDYKYWDDGEYYGRYGRGHSRSYRTNYRR